MREEVADFKKASILREAARQFYAKGYDGTRIDDIAAVLGVTKPFIYCHFRNKTALLDEVCEGATALSGVALDRAVAAAREPGHQLREAIRLLALQAIENQAEIAVCFREEKYISPGTRVRLEANRRRYNSMLGDILARAVREGVVAVGDPQLATQVMTGAITWSFVWFREGGRLGPQELAEQVVDLALAMLGAEGIGPIKAARG